MGSSIVKWFSLIKLIIKSSLPVNNENISTASESGQSLQDNIVKDYESSLFNLSDYTSDFLFNNIGPYSLVDLISNDELKEIDLSLFWENNVGQVYPIVLKRLESIRIKLIFMKTTPSNLINARHP